MSFKLGKKPFVKDHRDLVYQKYVDKTVLPPLPESFGHQDLIKHWGMLGNDTVGNCVIAGGDHETMLWTKEGSTEAVFTPATAISDYSAVTGYDPNDPDSDQGTEPRKAYLYRQKTGLIDVDDKRHKIGAFLALDPTDLNEVLEATYLFSASGIGLQVPTSAIDQFDAGQPWTVVPHSPIKGGHYVPVVGYDGTYLYCITWGKEQKMTEDFFTTYCDEAWSILSLEFLNSEGESPEGFNLAQLKADLEVIANAPKLTSPSVVKTGPKHSGPICRFSYHK
ncbi:MAG: hypothetical protein ACM3QW_02170 [Ignavibacteriales bacterium]